MRKPLLPLHVKGDHSFGLAVGSPAEYAARAAELALPAIALTDAESLAAQVAFHAACRDQGVKAITGAELAAPSSEGIDEKIVLLVEDGRGYANLCRLLTELDPRRGRSPRRALAAPSTETERARFVGELVAHADGLYFLTPSPSLLLESIDAGIRRSCIGAALTRPTRSPNLEARLVAAATSANVELVADPDVVMPSEADSDLLGLVWSIHARAKRARGSPRSPFGALSACVEPLFEDTPRAVDVARDVANRCHFDLLSLRVPAPCGSPNAAHALAERCRGEEPENALYAARLEKELATIQELGLSEYFLRVARLSDEARRRGTAVLARGSAVGSLVVHRLGLSPVDPVADGLYFERFVRAGRPSPPDIDLDVSSLHRDELVQWAVRRWGPTHVSEVGVYQTFQRRAALRDGLTALGMPASAVERFAARLPDDDLPVPLPADSLPEPYRSRIPLLQRLVGRPRNLSTHPSGVVMSGVPLRDWTPLSRAPKGSVVTQFDAAALEPLFASKIDVLGSRGMAALEEVSRWTGAPFLAAKTDDPATLASIDRGDTVGCTQLESPLVRSVLEATPIRSLGDIAVALALVRPGAASGSARERFMKRARHEEAPPAPSRLDSLLSATQGVCVFEEDLIRIIATTTNVRPDEADALRATLVRGEDVSARFLERAIGNGLEPREASAILQTLRRFAAYSFSKAHASSAAWLGYQAAFAKTHHAVAYACGLMNSPGGLYPVRALAAEMRRRGVGFLPPDVNASADACTVEGDAVRIGIDRLGHVARATKRRLMETRRRDGPFRSVVELARRLRPTSAELAAFVLSGSCDGLSPLTRDDYPFIHEAVLAALGASPNPPRTPASPAHLSVYASLVRTRNELLYLGMHPSAHPMEILRGEATRAGCVSTADVRRCPAVRLRFAGIVSAARRAAAGDGVVQFVTFEDEHGLLEATVAPEVHARLGHPIENPGPYLVEGRARRRHGSTLLVVDAAQPFHLRERPYR
ncbi:MAG TPA: PHP domain-containing protein [Polyangiaceae bacterium]|nr:PHP domain-containing protein [Polyangiaceae bacterium]